MIISDLHLGAEACQVHRVQDFLDSLPPTKRLILNGDVLENTEYRLTKQHWRVLSRLRKLADQLELVWVRGNHDCDAESVAHLIGANFVSEYEFFSGGTQILCVHGDSWDRFLTDHPILTNVADWFYLRMQRWSRHLAHRAKRNSKTFLRCVDRIRSEAVKYAQAKGVDAVVCGHTHHAESPSPEADARCLYFNSGCWTDHDCHYLTVDAGQIELRHAVLASETLGAEALV